MTTTSTTISTMQFDNVQQTVHRLPRLPWDVTEVINSFLFYPGSYRGTVRFKRSLVITFSMAATSRKHPGLCYDLHVGEDPDACECWYIWLEPYTNLKEYKEYEEYDESIHKEKKFNHWNCRQCGNYDYLTLFYNNNVSASTMRRISCMGHPQEESEHYHVL
jgi:hypothetical protein